MFFLSGLYASGRGVRRSAREQFQWMRRASEAGFAPAWLRLGQYYEEGIGTEPSIGEAARCYRRAANAGDTGG
jgi:TPR repeat protein